MGLRTIPKYPFTVPPSTVHILEFPAEYWPEMHLILPKMSENGIKTAYKRVNNMDIVTANGFTHHPQVPLYCPTLYCAHTPLFRPEIDRKWTVL